MESTSKYRDAILKVYKYKCQYCEQVLAPEELHIDHIIPKSKGGADSLDNYTVACRRCNMKKTGNLIPENYSAILLAKAKRKIPRILKCGNKSMTSKSIFWPYQGTRIYFIMGKTAFRVFYAILSDFEKKNSLNEMFFKQEKTLYEILKDSNVLWGGNGYQEIRKYFNKSKEHFKIIIETKEKTISFNPFIYTNVFKNKSNVYEFEFILNPKMKSLAKRICVKAYRYKMFLDIKSRYTFQLFQLLDQKSNFRKEIYFDLDFLKLFFGVGNEYKDVSNFMSRVIYTAIKEINKKTQMGVICRKIKRGRFIKGLEFIVKKDKRKKLSEQSP